MLSQAGASLLLNQLLEISKLLVGGTHVIAEVVSLTRFLVNLFLLVKYVLKVFFFLDNLNRIEYMMEP